MKTKLKTVIFSLSSGNIRNANSVFLQIPEKTREQLKVTKIANRASSRVRNLQKPGACVVIKQS